MPDATESRLGGSFSSSRADWFGEQGPLPLLFQCLGVPGPHGDFPQVESTRRETLPKAGTDDTSCLQQRWRRSTSCGSHQCRRPQSHRRPSRSLPPATCCSVAISNNARLWCSTSWKSLASTGLGGSVHPSHNLDRSSNWDATEEAEVVQCGCIAY